MLEIEALYRQYMGVMLRRAQSIVRAQDLAEDIAHEAFIRFIRQLRGENDVRDAGAFLFTTVTNLALNHVRDSKARNRLLEENVAPLIVQSLGRDVAQSINASIDVRSVLRSVRARDLQIAYHYHFDGMSQDEIADVTGISRRMVGRRLEAFSAKLRKLFKAPPLMASLPARAQRQTRPTVSWRVN